MEATAGIGRYLVLLPAQDVQAGADALRSVAGLDVVSVHDDPAASESSAAAHTPGDGVLIDALGVAVVEALPDQARALGTAVRDADTPVLAVEPERLVRALEGPGLSGEYLRGYRDAVEHLARAGLAEGLAPSPRQLDGTVTWAVSAVRADASALSGAGIRVAVLDTGFDVEHPDFAQRVIRARSFVPGEPVQDGHGHGTHCVGIACGPLAPEAHLRYGIAHDAEIYVCKVLNNQGSGGDREILTALGWAVEQGCHLASMSLGSPTQPGQPYSQVFEAAARRALSAGTATVAAAGNESRRSAGYVAPVGHPANCPSVMAVGAIDELGRVADFSCRSDPQGGRVDIAAPGVDVPSSWPMPARYRTISGTSMATPAVAGVAALLAEADPSARGGELLLRLLQSAAQLPASSADVGAGLVQAPTPEVTL